jgi:hypothetical protein
MSGRAIRRLSPILLAAALLAGCGGRSGSQPGTTATTTPETTAPPAATTTATTSLRAYFLHHGQVWPVARTVDATPAVAAASLDALAAGPGPGEGLETAVPAGFHPSIALEQGVARLDGAGQLDRRALAQVVYTLTQFPTIREVEIDGRRYARADFEPETPPILLESPLAEETVASPLRLRGTANTFEAEFQVEVLRGQKVLYRHFATATSGSGQRGTFDVHVPVDAAPGPVTVAVYELSAEDGSRIHEARIPLVLSG